MKISVLLVSLLFLFSCAEDKEIVNVAEYLADYELSQGKSEADDRIVELYDLYKSYFLYDFTQEDFEWTLVSNGTLSDKYSYVVADPKYAGDLLDVLDLIWFRFYPKEFHERYMPYKVLLVSELFNDDKMCYTRVVTNQIAVSYCSSAIQGMSQRQKIEYKNSLQIALWEDWLNRGVIDVSNEFYELSDYSSTASSSVSSANYARTRGFVECIDGTEWYSRLNYQTKMIDKEQDVNSFLTRMVSMTSEEWAPDLAYPLVKQKYDVLRNYFMENYKVDLKEIGDAICE